MPRLLCLGDSITDCGRLFSADPSGNGYVKILSGLLHNAGYDFNDELIPHGVALWTALVEKLLA